MRRAPLFLGIVVGVAALLFFVWSPAKLTKPAAGTSKGPDSQTEESTALRRDSQRPEFVEARAILRIEMSKNVETADLTSALGSLLERPQLDQISARLALETAWSMDTDRTTQKLAQVVKVSLSNDGSGGIVRASDVSPVMAARLANTAASVLRDHLEGKANDALKLEKSILAQQDLVADKRKLLASIVRSGMIIYQAGKENPAGDHAESIPQPPLNPPPHDGAVYVDAKGDFERATEQLSRMEDQRREAKKITIHHILWAEAKLKE